MKPTFAELEARCAALADVALSAIEYIDALPSMVVDTLPAMPGFDRDWAESVLKETPDTDAFLAEVRALGRKEGVNFAASRAAAAYNKGFIDKPLPEVYDVVRMILTAKEDLEVNPAEDGLSGEYAEKALEEWAEELRKGAAQ